MRIKSSLLTSVRTVGDAVRAALQRSAAPARRRQAGAHASSPSGPPSTYPGDFQGIPHLEYAPHEGTLPDPGEVAWTWVPYEEDYTRGKDRPVLIIGRDGGWLLALPLTSKDHDRDAQQEAAEGRRWFDVGRGAWDASGRASEVRVNRVVRIDPHAVRRTAGRLDKARYDAVADAVRRSLSTDRQ